MYSLYAYLKISSTFFHWKEIGGHFYRLKTPPTEGRVVKGSWLPKKSTQTMPGTL